MKVLLLSLFTFCFFTKTIAQISGKLVGSNGASIPFVSLLVLDAVDSSFVKGSLTDENGSFQIDNIRFGNLKIRVTGIGYQTWESPPFEFSVTQTKVDLGVIEMKEDSKQLGEVNIIAEKPLFEQRVDGTVVNLENSVLTKGSSALGVLERSPGVIVDHQNNSISLNGKSGVMVMLNGKIIRMPLAQVVAMLHGMSANDLEKIELLTTPPSKYDADGNAGLINIVLKKNKKKGMNGSVSLTAGYGVGEKGTGSLSLAHNSDKLNVYGTYTFSHDRTYSDIDIFSKQDMPLLGGRLEVTVLDTTKARHDNQNASLGLDYKLNNKTTIGGELNSNGNHSTVTTAAHAGYNVLPDSLLLFDGAIKGINKWKNLMASMYMEKEIKQGEKLNVNLDYLYFKNDNPSQVNSSFRNKNGTEAGANDSLFASRQNGFANTLIQVGVFKVDYSKSITPKIRLETGFKSTYSGGSSLSGIQSLIDGKWVNRSETSNEINMNEAIGAAYASLNTQINASLNVAAGVRYEYSHTRMDDPKTAENSVDRKLSALFPNISLAKKFNGDNELLLSYSKRVSRPSYNDLASYVAYSDPTAVYTGNPALKPTITNNMKVGYNYRGYSFSLLFSRDRNSIVRYQITERPKGNLLYVSPQNVTYQNNITFQSSLPVKLNNWWNMNYGIVGGLRQFKVDYTRLPVKKTYFGYSLTFGQTFKLPGNFVIEASGWYNSQSYNGSIKVGAFGALNIGLKKELKNNAGSLQLAVTDVLRTVHINTYYGTLTTEAFDIQNHVSINTESRKSPIVKFTFFKAFGNSIIKERPKQDTGSRDERGRIRKD